MIIELDKSNLPLAIAELHSIAKKVELLNNNFYIASVNDPSLLGMVKAAYKTLGTIDDMKQLKGSFKAISHTDLSNEDFAKKIWEKTEKKVDLKTPDNELHLFEHLVTKKVWERKQSKKSHEWEKNHPTSTDPKISKAMINLARIPRREQSLSKQANKLFDPFCGAGGILIEAGLMGLKAEGIDIDNKQILRAEDNLKQFGQTAKLMRANAFAEKWPEIIVTDLPYGRNSKIQINFFEKFFRKVRDCKRAVVGLPSDISYPKKLVTFSTEIYIHKSLTKRIIIIEF